MPSDDGSAAAADTTAASWVPSNSELFGWYDENGFTDEQLEKVAEVWAQVKEVEVPPSYSRGLKAWRTLFLGKFLVAREWDVDRAVAMFKASSEWRIVHRFEETPAFPSLFPVRGVDPEELAAFQGIGDRQPGLLTDFYLHHVRAGSRNGWHKWDKRGRPLLFEVIGGIKTELVHRCQALVPPGRPPSDVTLDTHLHVNEVGRVYLEHMNSQAASVDERNHQVSVVFDCSGLGMRHLWDPLVQLLKRNSTVDKRFMPEGLHRAYIVNAPTIVKAFWAIVKLWLEPRQIDKVKFFKPHETLEGLKEFIDEENIPDFLGGTCSCEGGCVPEYDKTLEDVELPVDHTREIVIKNRAKEVVSADWIKATEAGAVIGWQCHIAAYHCGFRTRFRPAAAADDWDGEWEDHGKVEHVEGSVTAPEAGHLELEFDNSYSMLRSKTALYRVFTPGDPSHRCGGLPSLFGFEPEDEKDAKK